MSSVEARDEQTLELTLNGAFAPFLATLVQFFVVDSATVKENEADGEHGERGDYGREYLKNNIAGSGPYTMESWQTGSEMIFEYFPDYWQGWEANQFSTARFKVVSEDTTVQTLLRQGEMDLHPYSDKQENRVTGS